MQHDLLIVGASTRAAAFSALRAGLRPQCADLFADVDLQARCPVRRLSPGSYPHGFLLAAQQHAPGPWMYTGGLENRPALVRDIAHIRPLWGTDADALARVRSPLAVAELLQREGLPCPAVRPGGDQPPPGRWLSKPLAGAGGAGIRFGSAEQPASGPQRYLQEYIEGEACAAIYVGDGQRAQLLGVTRQLVGENWLQAAPFRYCGSIGPLLVGPGERRAWERLGSVLAAGCRLRGLFGVDAVRRAGVVWPVEINPRYTASVEVLEYATGLAALALHRRVFEPPGSQPSPPAPARPRIVGKAILFARAALTFPTEGPWLATLREPFDPWQLPAYADIPPPGQVIEAGRPILTCFAQADDPDACLEQLRRRAVDLEPWLWKNENSAT